MGARWGGRGRFGTQTSSGGRAGGRRKPGRRLAAARESAEEEERRLQETMANNVQDLRRCRELLVELDEDICVAPPSPPQKSVNDPHGFFGNPLNDSPPP